MSLTTIPGPESSAVPESLVSASGITSAPPPMPMSWKQWALDVGFWEAQSVDEWSWTAFRPVFWKTVTNKTHRSYRAAFTELTEFYCRQLRHFQERTEALCAEAYEQGKRDGAQQARDIFSALRGEDPNEFYTS